MKQNYRHGLGAVALCALVAGCSTDTGESVVSRFAGMVPGVPAMAGDEPVSASVADIADASPIIDALRTRRSAISAGSPYDRVAQAVMASDARVAEANLAVARLRVEAAQHNWLPTIGPDVSLTSLSEVVAALVIEQVIFDNGRKVAERDKAKADVELAAVALVEDGNERVYEALSLYLIAEEGRDTQAHFGIALTDMTEFERVMNRRVEGGVSDMSDLNVLRQKLNSIKAQREAAMESTGTALAELNAMSGTRLDDLRGLGDLRMATDNAPLGVLRSEAEREVSLAEARISRASYLPGLGLEGEVSDDGFSASLEVTTDSLFGLGTMAELKAIETGKTTAERQVTVARERAAREIASQQARLDAYRRQLSETRLLTVSAKQNLDLFQRQYDGGQRQVMDVVGVYETYAASLEKEISLRYQAGRAELELARLKGALAEGTRM